MTFEFFLWYRRVDTDIDLDSIHGTFFEDDMDVLVGCGQLETGRLALDVSVEDDDAHRALDRALRTARRALGNGELVKVGPEVEDLKEIGFLTELPAADLKAYAQQPWFPSPTYAKDTYRVDEVVKAIQTHAEVPVDPTDSLVAGVRAARAVNDLLKDLNG